MVGGTTVAEAGSGETASYTPPANPIKKSEIQNTGSDTPPAIHNSYTRPSGGAPARKSNQVAIRTDEAAPTTVEHIPFGSAAYSAGSKSKGGTAGGGNGNNSDQKDKDLKRKNSPAPPPGPIRSGNQQGNAPAVRQPLQGSTTYTAPVPQNGKKKKDPVKADRASAGRNEKGKVSEKGRADNAMTVVMSKDKSVKPTAGKREEPKGAAVNNSNSNQEQTKDGAGSTAGRSKQLALDPEGTRLDGNNEYVGFGPVGTPYQKGKSPDQPGLSKTPRKPMVYREIYPVFGIKTDIIPWVGLQANDFKMYSFVPNIEAEFFFAQRFSVAGQGEYMKRPQRDDKYFGRSAWSLEPRVWIKGDSRFRWAYVGLYGEVGDFDNIANYLPKDTGKTGFFFGGGIAAGVYIPIQPRFGIEVGARAGFTQWEVDDYSYEAPIYYLDERNKFGTWGLTEVKVSLSYRFGKSFAGKPPRRIIR